MIELIYLFTAFQCGSNAEMATFTPVVNGTPMEINVPVRVDSIQSFEIIPGANSSCALAEPVVLNLGTNDTIPTYLGAYEQESLVNLVAENVGDDDYKFLWLWEYGSTDPNSSVFDMNDLGVLVDFNADIPAD